MEGRVVEWNNDRGYGFISSPISHQRLFFHISSVNGRRRPDVNDDVQFSIGQDKRGDACAIDVRLRESFASRISLPLVFSSTFLVALISSYIIFDIDRLFVGAYLGMSVLTFMLYASDKNSAQNGEQRIRESTLHMFALCCGWPGALIAQQTLRHKSVKQPFKAILWLTTILNCAAFLFILTPQGIVYFDHFIYNLGILLNEIVSSF